MRLIVFLGPSLPAAEARAIADCTVLPPARQGDIWRALGDGAAVIALIDGVFEATPSVWHHELLLALASGVAVFGASSMGALRAAELHTLGMRGVGRIFSEYRDGLRVDDADVALLHADADNDFRPLTVPLVNAEHAAAQAMRARVLSEAQAAALVRTARRMFYQDRGWPSLLRQARLPPEVVERFRAFLKRRTPDLKAQDARACILAAAKFASSARAQRPTIGPGTAAGSSLVRRRRLHESPQAQLQTLRALPNAEELTRRGTARALLAGLARTRGVKVPPRALQREREARFGKGPLPYGMSAAEADLLVEDVLLEQWVLANATHLLPDGTSSDEALVAEARLRAATGDRPSRGRGARGRP